MGRYAKQTAVPIAKSRQEIDQTLRRWGAKQVQWSDDYDGGRAMLRFFWEYEEQAFAARFTIAFLDDTALRDECVDGRTGGFSQTKYDKALKRIGMVEHRELALLIKAIFVAVDAGIISAEEIFLPFLEDDSGSTVAQIVLPQLAKMTSGLKAGKLLTSGRK